jgi:integrase
MGKFIEGYADKLQVPAGKRDVLVFDDELPGFGIRKYASGSAVYIVKYQTRGKPHRFKLGPVVRGDLKQMRLRASDILYNARRGIDVAAEAEKAKREAAQTVTLGELVPIYLRKRRDEVRAKTYVMMEIYLARTWQALHAIPVKDITRQAIVRIIDGMERKVTADRARVALSTFFAWAIEAGHCEANPTMHIKARAGNTKRNRVLSEEELVEVWRACEDDDFGTIVRLLILTGQRRTEIGSIEWSEVSFGKRQIELPAARTKNGQPHIVPLADAALELLRHVERKQGSHQAFAFNSYSHAKAALDARITAARGGEALDHWTVHDLRRSFVTHVADLNFAQPHIIEAIVNHISGAKAGVAGVYNRAIYSEEKRAALTRWAAYITGLVDGPLCVQQSPELEKPAQFTK